MKLTFNRSEPVFRATALLSRIMLSQVFRLEVTGIEHLPAKSGFILLPKHQRWEDIPLLGLATPASIYYVAKHELFTNPAVGAVLKMLGGIPLNRNRPIESRRSIRYVLRLLKAGQAVVVFPEGTYYRNRVGPGRIGMVRLLLSRVSLPFIPVGINYSWRRHRTLVRIVYGTPVQGDLAGSPDEFLESIMGKIAWLSGLQRMGVDECVPREANLERKL